MNRIFYLMFIRTEITPNPAVLKFVLGTDFVITETPLSFNMKHTGALHPLAEGLLLIHSIEEVFLHRDFISVKKGGQDIDWTDIKPQVLSCIMEYMVTSGSYSQSSQSEIEHPVDAKQDLGSNDANDPIIKEIIELIEEKVRPAVAMDGGDIVFRGYKDGIVFLSLHGACSGCPSASITLKHGVESMLQHHIPEIKGVEAI